MNNQEPNQIDNPIEPRSPSGEPDNRFSDSSGSENRQADPVNPVKPIGTVSDEMKKKINVVEDEDRALINTTSQPDVSSKENPAIAESFLDKQEVDELRTRWNAIQFEFVDSPCSAVEQGDTLVADVIEHINRKLASIQNTLNQQWLNHDEISTEELRHTLQNYRIVLDKLLSL